MKPTSFRSALFVLLMLALFLPACGSSENGTPPSVMASPTTVLPSETPQPPTPTATTVPTATITLTPTSTPQSLMVSQTPVAINKITVENASQLALLTKLNPGSASDVLAFSTDGTSLASGLAKEAFWPELLGSNVIQIWDISAGEVAHTIDIPGTLTNFVFEEDHLKIATCTNGAPYGCLGSEILHWEASDQSLAGKGSVKGLIYAFPPTDMPIVLHLSTSSYDNYQLWNVQGGTNEKLYDISQTLEWDASLAHSSDGEHFAIGLGTLLKLYTTGSDQPVVLEDPNDVNKKRYTAMVFSPDGSILAAGNGGGKIKLWNVSDGTAVRALDGHLEMIDTMAFSADGALLATISSDNSLRIWNTADGTSLVTVNGVCGGSGYKAGRCSIAFSPTGTLIATVGWPDKNIQIWGIQ